MRKFILCCKNKDCKKPILKSNPVIKKVQGSFSWKGELAFMALSAVDIKTEQPVVLPNVYCPNCKFKNVFEESDIIFTGALDKKAKAELEKKIKDSFKADVVEKLEDTLTDDLNKPADDKVEDL